MNLPIILTPEASREFDEATDWYEREAELGADFILKVDDALDRIAKAPEMQAKIHRNTRRARLVKYPYYVFYQIRRNSIEVTAIIHTSRDPSVWKRRT